MLDRAAALLFNLDARVAGSAIAVIAVVVVGSFLGVRSQQSWTAPAVSFGIQDGAREVRGDRALAFAAPDPLSLQTVRSAFHIQPAADGRLAASRDGRGFTWQPSPPLADRTSYTVRVDSLRDTGGRPVRGGVWHFRTTTVPRVDSASLDSGARVVDGGTLPVGAELRLTFNEAMDPSTVKVLANGSPLALSWSRDRRSASLKAQGLQASQLQLTLAAGRDQSGRPAAAWRLSATLVDAAAPGSRRLRAPALVQIANDVGSRDQSGLQSADAVYEYLTEGGITRFTAVFSRVPEVVGPVNSGRPISLKLARHYRGMLFMSDLSRGSTARLTTDPVPTSLDVQDTFYRSANRPAQDNLFVTGTGMEQAEERLGVSTSVLIPPRTTGIAGDAGGDVRVAEHHSTYKYDPGSGTYSKVEDGHQLQDADRGAPVRIRLLVVLHSSAAQTTYAEDAAGHRALDFDLDSGGIADFYLGGKHASGRWSTSDRNDPLRFSLDDGTSVGVADGLTWFDVVTG